MWVWEKTQSLRNHFWIKRASRLEMGQTPHFSMEKVLLNISHRLRVVRTIIFFPTVPVIFLLLLVLITGPGVFISYKRKDSRLIIVDGFIVSLVARAIIDFRKRRRQICLQPGTRLMQPGGGNPKKKSTSLSQIEGRKQRLARSCFYRLWQQILRQH